MSCADLILISVWSCMAVSIFAYIIMLSLCLLCFLFFFLFVSFFFFVFFFFFQAEDGIRDLVRSRGLGDVYKRQGPTGGAQGVAGQVKLSAGIGLPTGSPTDADGIVPVSYTHLTLPTSDLV